MKDKYVFSLALIHVQYLGTQIISNMNTSSANFIFSFVFESSKNHYLKNGTQIEISQDFQNTLDLCDKRSKSWKKNRVTSFMDDQHSASLQIYSTYFSIVCYFLAHKKFSQTDSNKRRIFLC